MELEKDLAMCESVSSYTCADSQALVAKLQNWKTFLSSAKDLPQSVKKELEGRIDEANGQLQTHLQAIQEAINSIFTSARNA